MRYKQASVLQTVCFTLTLSLCSSPYLSARTVVLIRSRETGLYDPQADLTGTHCRARSVRREQGCKLPTVNGKIPKSTKSPVSMLSFMRWDWRRRISNGVVIKQKGNCCACDVHAILAYLLPALGLRTRHTCMLGKSLTHNPAFEFSRKCKRACRTVRLPTSVPHESPGVSTLCIVLHRLAG